MHRQKLFLAIRKKVLHLKNTASTKFSPSKMSIATLIPPFKGGNTFSCPEGREKTY